MSYNKINMVGEKKQACMKYRDICIFTWVEILSSSKCRMQRKEENVTCSYCSDCIGGHISGSARHWVVHRDITNDLPIWSVLYHGFITKVHVVIQRGGFFEN